MSRGGGGKANGRKWLKKAVVCRKEILDPKVKETEEKLKGKKGEVNSENAQKGQKMAKKALF